MESHTHCKPALTTKPMCVCLSVGMCLNLCVIHVCWVHFKIYNPKMCLCECIDRARSILMQRHDERLHCRTHAHICQLPEYAWTNISRQPSATYSTTHKDMYAHTHLCTSIFAMTFIPYLQPDINLNLKAKFQPLNRSHIFLTNTKYPTNRKHTLIL